MSWLSLSVFADFLLPQTFLAHIRIRGIRPLCVTMLTHCSKAYAARSSHTAAFVRLDTRLVDLPI